MSRYVSLAGRLWSWRLVLGQLQIGRREWAVTPVGDGYRVVRWVDGRRVEALLAIVDGALVPVPAVRVGAPSPVMPLPKRRKAHLQGATS